MKRTRFTVEFADGTKKVCLAYTGPEASAYYSVRGWSVLRVTKGDYRKTVKRPTGARPNRARIREAIDFLDLALPVNVRVVNHQHGCYGAHKAKYDAATGQWSHDIIVKSWLTAEQMGHTIWHELAHAMQFERDAWRPGLDVFTIRRTWHTAYRDGTTYRRKPYEVEARSYEPHNDEIALAR